MLSHTWGWDVRWWPIASLSSALFAVGYAWPFLPYYILSSHNFLGKTFATTKVHKKAISCYAESHIPCLAFLFRQGLKSPWYPRNLVWAELSCEGKVMFGKVRKERNRSVKEMLRLEKLIELCRAKDRHSDQHLHRHDLADIMMEWSFLEEVEEKVK